MADQPFDVRRAIEQSSSKSTLQELAKKGIHRVKVLDEHMINKLIGEAVERILSTKTNLLSTDDRQKLIDASRKELDRLIKDHQSTKDQAELMQKDKESLVTEVENLQNQLKTTRTLGDDTAKQRYEDGKALMKAEVDNLKKQLSSMEAELTTSVRREVELEFQVKTAALQGIIDQMKADAVHRDNDLRNQFSTVKQRFEEGKAALKAELEDAKKKTASMEEEITRRVRHELELEHQAKAAALQSNITQMQGDGSRREKELRDQLDAAKQRHEEAKAVLVAEADDLKKKLASMAALETEIPKRVRQELESEYQAKAAALQATLEQLKGDGARRESELRDQLDAAKRRHEEARAVLTAEADDLKKKLASMAALETEIPKRVRQELELEYQAKTAALQATLEQVKGEAAHRDSDLRSQFTVVRQRFEEGKAALQTELEDAKKKLASMASMEVEIPRRVRHEVELEYHAKSAGLQATLDQLRGDASRRENELRDQFDRREKDLREELSRREQDIAARGASMKEAELRSKLDEMQNKNMEMAGKHADQLEELKKSDDKVLATLSELFNKAIEGVNKKLGDLRMRSIAGVGAGGSMGRIEGDVEFRPSQMTLETLIGGELESNLKSMQVEAKSGGKISNALDRLKAMRSGGGGEAKKVEKEEKK